MYNADKKLYNAWRADDQGGGMMSTGTWDADSKTLTWAWKDPDGTSYTAPEHFVDADTITWEFIAKNPQGQVVNKGGGTTKRKK